MTGGRIDPKGQHDFMPSTRVSNGGGDAQLALLSYADLRELGITCSRATLDRMVRRGDFPRPVKIGKHRNGFRRGEVMEWLNREK